MEVLRSSQWHSMNWTELPGGKICMPLHVCGCTCPAFGDALPDLHCSHLQFLVFWLALQIQSGLEHMKHMLTWTESRLTWLIKAFHCLALKEKSLVALSVC